jgi:hypothetical protein
MSAIPRQPCHDRVRRQLAVARSVMRLCALSIPRRREETMSTFVAK